VNRSLTTLLTGLAALLLMTGIAPAQPASDDVEIGPRSSDAVVFLHGWLMGPEMWRHQLDELCGERRCLAVAQPGHGSPPLTEPLTMTHWAERLRDHLDSAGIERAVLVGHSMGGMLALEFVRRYPERVLGLGLVATTDTPGRPEVVPGIARQLAQWNDEVANGWARYLIGRTFLSEHPDWLPGWRGRVSDYDFDRLPELMKAIQEREDLTGFTPTIDVPTTVIHCTTDGAVPFAQGKALADRIPEAELVAVEDCGHASPIERPEAATRALAGLLEKVEAHGGE